MILHGYSRSWKIKRDSITNQCHLHRLSMNNTDIWHNLSASTWRIRTVHYRLKKQRNASKLGTERALWQSSFSHKDIAQYRSKFGLLAVCNLTLIYTGHILRIPCTESSEGEIQICWINRVVIHVVWLFLLRFKENEEEEEKKKKKIQSVRVEKYPTAYFSGLCCMHCLEKSNNIFHTIQFLDFLE